MQLLLDRFQQRLPPPRSPHELFDQRDAILITYGDSFLSADRAPLAALGAFASAHLADLFSSIHILPFFPYSSDYGFSVVDYLQVNPELGNWHDVAAMRGFKLMFDFVLNHASARSNWFHAFLRGEPPYDGFFITVDPGTDLSSVTRPRTTPLLTRFETAHGERWVWTTFGSDQVDLNYANPEVLLRMVEVMLTYVERGAELLRMDAVGYLWKEPGTTCLHLPQTHQIVKLFRDVLDAVAPHVAIVTETNVAHNDNVSYFGDGLDEAQMVYQFPLAPLVLDCFARADATRLSGWASGLSTPSTRTTFFNFLASHDGIGVVPAAGILSKSELADLAARVRGHGGEVSFKTDPGGGESPYELNATFFDALSDPADRGEPWSRKRDRFLCSQAVMLSLAGVPGIYVHSLFGSHNDSAGYARSGWKRDLNHERLQLAEVEEWLARPTSEPGQVFTAFAHLLRVRRAQAAFHPAAPQRMLGAGGAVFAVQRGPFGGQTLLALHNVSAVPQAVDAGALAGSATAPLDVLSGTRVNLAALRLGPYEVRWLDLIS